MIQEIAPHALDLTFPAPLPPQDGDIVLAYDRGGLWCHPTGELFRRRDISEEGQAQLRYLFTIDTTAFYLAEASAIDEQYPLHQVKARYALRTMEPSWQAFGAATGLHLNHWYHTHRFCSACGEAIQHSSSERALVCPQCQFTVYPRISPAVIVAISDGQRLLLSRYANGPTPRWALIAGYVEIGETLEDTVHREVAEETGLKVKDLRYFKNQPWGFSQSLLLGFFAELDGPSEIHLRDGELAEARWFLPQEISPLDNKASLTNTMIAEFIRTHSAPPNPDEE